MKVQTKQAIFPWVISITLILIALVILIFEQGRRVNFEPERTLEWKSDGQNMVIVGKNSVISIAPSYYGLESNVLGCLVETHFPNDVVLSELAERIIWCESRNNTTVCNAEFGCRAGMGLFQLIPSTVKYCEEKLGKKIDPFNAQDNIQCGMWLLENEGTAHWGTSETDWGSWECWSK